MSLEKSFALVRAPAAVSRAPVNFSETSKEGLRLEGPGMKLKSRISRADENFTRAPAKYNPGVLLPGEPVRFAGSRSRLAIFWQDKLNSQPLFGSRCCCLCGRTGGFTVFRRKPFLVARPI